MDEPMTVGALAETVGGRVVGDPDRIVCDITHDSRDAASGVMFAAVRGYVADGHDYLEDAATAGGDTFCVERADAIPEGATALVVDDVRRALGPLAAQIHGHPSHRLRVVGITGTNGKTTVTHLVESIASASGIQQAIVGTVGARINGKAFPVERTTPEASDFQRLLATMADLGVDVAAVEVSSHALSLGRVAATDFAVGAFTNLSQDHLDFHADMEEYLAAKRSLFDQVDTAVIWVDDPTGSQIADELTIPVVRVGTGPDADVRGEAIAVTMDGSTIDAAGPGGGARIHLQLRGRFNVANALVAAGCASVLGIPWDTIADGIARVDVIPGRFEVVPTDSECTVVVDYAHTPEGVAAAISAGRELVGDGKVIAVAGSAGDRDREKRPLMGSAAATADVTVITSDNPRSEDPDSIISEVLVGAGPDAIVEPDRRQAIARAIELAEPPDLVLILGKGHEASQEIEGEFRPFDDRLVAQEVAAP